MCNLGTGPDLHGAGWGQAPFCTVQIGACPQIAHPASLELHIYIPVDIKFPLRYH